MPRFQPPKSHPRNQWATSRRPIDCPQTAIWEVCAGCERGLGTTSRLPSRSHFPESLRSSATPAMPSAYAAVSDLTTETFTR
jgi:hypothetical protein